MDLAHPYPAGVHLILELMAAGAEQAGPDGPLRTLGYPLAGCPVDDAAGPERLDELGLTNLVHGGLLRRSDLRLPCQQPAVLA